MPAIGPGADTQANPLGCCHWLAKGPTKESCRRKTRRRQWTGHTAAQKIAAFSFAAPEHDHQLRRFNFAMAAEAYRPSKQPRVMALKEGSRHRRRPGVIENFTPVPQQSHPGDPDFRRRNQKMINTSVACGNHLHIHHEVPRCLAHVTRTGLAVVRL